MYSAPYLFHPHIGCHQLVLLILEWYNNIQRYNFNLKCSWVRTFLQSNNLNSILSFSPVMFHIYVVNTSVTHIHKQCQ